MHKYIVTHKAGNTTHTNGFVMPDYYNHSYELFGELVKEARETFPDLKDCDIDCRTVLTSRWCKAHPIIRFLLPNGSEADGWKQCSERLPDIIL